MKMQRALGRKGLERDKLIMRKAEYETGLLQFESGSIPVGLVIPIFILALQASQGYTVRPCF